ncbi:MAG: hypothetical protein QOI66_3968 [Myxococcales bacterium]|jgi:dienelactone hydrolase|nr:hypothetical protein [Myxococcales bacterium]
MTGMETARSRMVAVIAAFSAVGSASCDIEGQIEDPPRPAPGLLHQRSEINSDVAGHWYLDRGGQRFTLTVIDDHGTPTGFILPERVGATALPLMNFSATKSPSELTFQTMEDDGTMVWYHLQMADGITVGRFAMTTSAERPDQTLFQGQLMGWRDETFSADGVPRVFEITVPNQFQGVLRLDGPLATAAASVGQLKIYADNHGAMPSTLDEQLSEDVAVTVWDGTRLRFVRSVSPNKEQFDGVVSGRLLAGTMSQPDSTAVISWTGERAEILSHGIDARPAATMNDWQTRTRERLSRLIMAGNPAPLTTSVSVLSTRAPLQQLAVPLARDDDFARWPQSYHLDELYFRHTLPNPYGPDPLVREAHGFIAVPTTDPPAHGYPVALALNGHGGSALRDFDPQNPTYWYGDGFARRGYVVVAVDISHRPLGDRQTLYGDALTGDDPGNGNGTHPAIRDAGFLSDWEEDGERAWDAMRALDYVLARPDVDPSRVTVVGLSMGGEVTDWVGALDTRIGATLAAGSPPDLAVMQLLGNHPCFNWVRGRVREYVDPADLHALVAPRTLIRETGILDTTYSGSAFPFASAKQVVRRAQPAFDALGGTLIHYMHTGAHVFRVGDAAPGFEFGDGVTAPMLAAPVTDDDSSEAWESDHSTTVYSVTSLFDILPR